MVTDDMPTMVENHGDYMAADGGRAARDQRIASQKEQVAQYWRRCNEPASYKLSRSLSTSDTHIGEDEYDDGDDAYFDENDGDDDEQEYEYEYRYVHYRRRSSSQPRDDVSGLPLVCGNCGVSFFSLRSGDDDAECYCSGECKWSVIMYREMDRRMGALRAGRVPLSYASTCGQESEAGCTFDDVISCH